MRRQDFEVGFTASRGRHHSSFAGRRVESESLRSVVHLWKLDSLPSRPQARLDCCCRQRRSDRLFLRGSDVSEVRLVLASHVLHGGLRDLVLHCLAAKLLIWTLFAAEASGCFCRESTVALDLPCSHPAVGPLFSPAVGLFTLVLVKAAWTSRCFRLSVAPCATFSLANCSLAARGFLD